MATPVGRNVSESFKPMRDAVVDFLLVGIGLVVGFANTLGDNLGVTFAMASILAIGALHPRCIFQEVAAKCTTHNIIELLRNELVALLFVDLFLPLSDSTLAIQSNVERSSILQLLGCKQWSSVTSSYKNTQSRK